jgi:uncharacterized protein
MTITVKVKAGAKQAKVEKISENNFLVHVKEKPQDGKANYAVREALADHLGLPRSRVLLVRGEKAKEKIFEIIS